MLETYLQDLAEVVNLDCGSANCEGVTKVANIMKRHFDSIGFATELVDLGPKAGKGLFATNKPGAEKVRHHVQCSPRHRVSRRYRRRTPLQG